MIHWPTLKKALHGWAVAQSGYADGKVLWAEQNAPLPSRPCLTMKISSLVQVKEDFATPPDDDGIAMVHGDREFTLSIQAFGGEPMAVLEILKNSLHRFEVKQTMPEGLAFVEPLGINSVSELLDSKYEDRAALDLLCRIPSQFGADGTTDKPYTTDEVGLIEDVKIEGASYEHPGGIPIGG